MHLLTILAFACLFWQAEDPGRWILVAKDDVWWTLSAALAPAAVATICGMIATARARHRLRKQPHAPHLAHQFHQRVLAVLRGLLLAGLAAAVFLTNWCTWLALGTQLPSLQIVGDLIAVSPFVVGLILLWITAYPLEEAMRVESPTGDETDSARPQDVWRFGAYLDFHVRHYLLIVAIPMTFILFAANITRYYEKSLQSWTGVIWAADGVLGIVAAVVFVIAPVILRRIWRTRPLESGPIRDRLEAICQKVGLRCRDILVWESGGVMINAAVMGVLPTVRYVLLSDALLASMTPTQVEAVFGHEVGHVKHRHIQHFLVFAFVGWVIVAGTMEGLARLLGGEGEVAGSMLLTVEGVGVAATIIFWAVGFGWLSRRFERQADLFGAHCVTPGPQACIHPCSVHADRISERRDESRVCMTGAHRFASALDRVAILNGIPHEEHSWRHSSIGVRTRFLMALAGDPIQARRFDRVIARAKKTMIFVAVAGALCSAYYWQTVSQPAIMTLQLAPVESPAE